MYRLFCRLYIPTRPLYQKITDKRAQREAMAATSMNAVLGDPADVNKQRPSALFNIITRSTAAPAKKGGKGAAAAAAASSEVCGQYDHRPPRRANLFFNHCEF